MKIQLTASGVRMLQKVFRRGHFAWKKETVGSGAKFLNIGRQKNALVELPPPGTR